MAKIAILSDLHENLPDIKNVDMAIFCGDFCFRPCGDYLAEATVWYARLGPYFEELRRRNILLVGIPGNHDFLCELYELKSHIANKYFDLFSMNSVFELGYLEDFTFAFSNVCKVNGWAFDYMSDNDIEGEFWYNINYDDLEDIDFLITHTGPHDILSCQDWGIKPIGDLAKEIKPKHFHAFGHIHSRFGMVEKDGITYVNCSYVKEDYSPRNQYVTYDTETRKFDLVDCENL